MLLHAQQVRGHLEGMFRELQLGHGPTREEGCRLCLRRQGVLQKHGSITRDLFDVQTPTEKGDLSLQQPHCHMILVALHANLAGLVQGMDRENTIVTLSYKLINSYAYLFCAGAKVEGNYVSSSNMVFFSSCSNCLCLSLYSRYTGIEY